MNERIKNQSYRTLSRNNSLIDFCSNDYLGFARSLELKSEIEHTLNSFENSFIGATGSRLISGNSIFLEELEQEIALFHNAEAGLIFNSGYDANLGLLACLPQRTDTVIIDELIHASIIDGIRLSTANKYTFKHNDLNHLQQKLQAAKGKVFVVIESIYSMDGDEAPLEAIVKLVEEYNAALIVDEAHAVGVFGNQGRGLISQYNLQERVFARIVTFGKALGVHGALVLGSDALRNYLINYSRSFIYSTAATFHTHLAVKTAYKYLQKTNYQDILKQKIKQFRENAGSFREKFVDSTSPIQCLLIPGNENAKTAAQHLQKEGFNVRAILHPTVAEGKERLRICLHSFNSDDDIKSLINHLKILI